MKLGPFAAPGFHCADVLDALAALPDECVQCVVTSPPYYLKRGYDGSQSRIWDLGDPDCVHEWFTMRRPTTPGGLAVRKAKVGATKRGVQREIIVDAACLCGAWRGALGTERNITSYVRHCLDVTREIERVLKPDGVLFWNVGDSYDPARPKSLLAVPERMTLALIDQGWIVRSSLVWHKPSPIPCTTSDRLFSAHEIVIIATKRKRYRWRSFPAWRHDVWKIGYPKIEGGNSASFPPELVRRAILHATEPGDVVLDPFAGSGTTLAVAAYLDRVGLGFDVSASYVKRYAERRKAIERWFRKVDDDRDLLVRLSRTLSDF